MSAHGNRRESSYEATASVRARRHAPGGTPTCALISCYNGSAEDGQKAMQPFREALPKPIIDWMGPMPFSAPQGLFDGLFPKGLQWYWKGDFVKELSDAAIDAHIAHASKSPTELSLMKKYDPKNIFRVNQNIRPAA